MHVDTGHNFPEVIEFRDRAVEAGRRPAGRGIGAGVDRRGPGGRGDRATRVSRNRLQTTTLLDAITGHRFDAVFGGARRDEEKARAKERVFSFRDEFGQWDPKNQRPELWNLYNGRHRNGEHFRVFPLCNWTELDIWQYIAEEEIELPSIYFAHRRKVFRRDGMLLAVGPFVTLMDDEDAFEMAVRYRTVGDATCTGAVESTAATVAEVDRRGGGHADHRAGRHPRRRPDLRSGHGGPQAGGLLLMGMVTGPAPRSDRGVEDRKREGYF